MENAANNGEAAPAKRVVGKPFAKGKSGNPSGRPKIPECVVEAAKAHTEIAINTLVECCGENSDDRVRVMAAEALLNRAWGKPVERTELTGKDGERLVAAIEWRVVGSAGASHA